MRKKWKGQAAGLASDSGAALRGQGGGRLMLAFERKRAHVRQHHSSTSRPKSQYPVLTLGGRHVDTTDA